jgi:Zn-dependent protease
MKKWSLKIGSVAGIVIQVHATFAIIVVWLGLQAWTREPSLASVADGVGFVLALFACIVLHELGHALMARRFGIRTRDITLLPIGGVARLERMPEDPRQEWLVAMAGPAVTVLVAAVLFGALVLLGAPPGAASASGLGEAPFLERLMWVNVALAVFNLIPAFPMDGGRALRAILSMWMPAVRATRVAAGLGQAIALLFGAIGFFANPFLIFIALFVWIGAAAEVGLVETRAALEGVSVADAMLTDFETLRPGDPLARAVELTLAGSQKDFPVIEEGRDALLGVLTQEGLVRALSEGGPSAPVGPAMHPAPAGLSARVSLLEVLDRLDSSRSRLLPVMEGGVLAGILTADNVFELMRFRAALEAAGKHRAGQSGPAPTRSLPAPGSPASSLGPVR